MAVGQMNRFVQVARCSIPLRGISLRESLIFQQFGSEDITAVEELTCRQVGDALLAVMAKSNRVLPIMARRAR